MSRATSPSGILHAVAAERPELALIGAMVRLAVDDAGRGDPEARQWLASPACLRWLAWIVPPEVDPLALQGRILARLPPVPAEQVTLPLEGDAA